MQDKNVKVLLIVQNNSYPFDTRVFKEAKSLTNAGYSVFVISPMSPRDPRRKETLDSVKIYRYKDYPSTGSKISYILEYTNALSKIFYYIFYLVFTKKIKVVHFANPPDFFFPISYFLKFFNVKTIFDQHDLVPELFKLKFKNELMYKFVNLSEKLMVKSSDAIIVVNHSFKERLDKKWNLNGKMCEVIYNGPLEEFEAKENANLINQYKNNRIVLYIGLMSYTDNIDFIIELADKIIYEYNKKDVKFILLGDGDVRSKMEKLSVEKNLCDYIEFKGNVSQNTVMEYLYISNVCIAPDMPNNLNEYLTLVKVFEYMKAKKAFVCFDLEETKRVSSHAGIYASDRNDFVEKVLYLLENPNKAKDLGYKGSEIIEKHYLWKYFDYRLINLYKKLIKH